MSPVLSLIFYFIKGREGCSIEVGGYPGGNRATSRVNQFEQISAEKPDKKFPTTRK
jgi:hypothetical protein